VRLKDRLEGYLASNVEALAGDSVLSRYVWAILLGHVACYLFFLTSGKPAILLAGTEPLCWPFFPGCWQWRFESPIGAHVLLGVYLAATLATAATLRLGRWRAAYLAMVGLCALLVALICLDYRFRQNQFYMFLWTNLVLLAVPDKHRSLPLMVASFYFWAGHLKLNYEWISGAVLYHQLWFVPRSLVEPACIYVIVLEMVFIWGLFAKRALLRWATLGQLALFHLESLSQIGWFYPVIMGCILAYFPLAWRGEATSAEPGESRWPRWPPWSRPALGAAAVFGCLQLVPQLFRGDPALTGQGRVFALHMFEARQRCDVDVTRYSRDLPPEHLDLKMRDLPSRIVCDPIIYYDRVANLCREGASDPRFVDVDFRMRIKRTTDKDYTSLIDQTGFCSGKYEYRLFSNNVWMQ
jgi:hypothetical protein